MQYSANPLLTVARLFAFLATGVLTTLWLCACEPKVKYWALALLAGIVSGVLHWAYRNAEKKARDISERELVDRTQTPLGPLGLSLTFKEPLPLEKIGDLYAVFQSVFGQEILGLPILRGILVHNPSTIWRVGIEPLAASAGGPADREYVGFFEVFPLTPSGVKALQSGKKDGRSFTAKDVCKRNSDTSDYYVASVGALPGVRHAESAKAAVVRELWSYLSGLNEDRPIRIYARPVTDDGLRLIKNNGFTRLVDDPNESETDAIWVRSLKAGELMRRGT